MDEWQEFPVDAGATDTTNEPLLTVSVSQDTQERQREWKSSLHPHVNYVA